MKQFKIYEWPEGKYEAVKQGWSWPAFFFWFIWAFVKKMWAVGFVMLAGSFILGFIDDATASKDPEHGLNGLTTIVGLVLGIVCGGNGNKWRETNLMSRGFDFKGTVTAANGEGAIALYIKNSSANQNS